MCDIFRSSIVDGCMPGVSAALGFAAGTPACDIKIGAQLLGNMKATYEGALSTNGSRFAGPREIAEAVASAVFGPGLNAASVGRVAGISPEILKKGAQLKAANETAGSSQASSSVKVMREHSYPLQKVHTVDCTKVEIDKQTKRVYKRKLFTLPNGTKVFIFTVSIVSGTAPRRNLRSRTKLKGTPLAYTSVERNWATLQERESTGLETHKTKYRWSAVTVRRQKEPRCHRSASTSRAPSCILAAL